MAPQPRDIETLVANRGMHKKLTLKDIDYILAHDKQVKLPDRRWLQAWNSFDIQNFRGFNEDAQEYEKNRNENIKRVVEIREAASSQLPTVNAEFFNEQARAIARTRPIVEQIQRQFDRFDQQASGALRADAGITYQNMRRAQLEEQRRLLMRREMRRRHVDREAVDRSVLIEDFANPFAGMSSARPVLSFNPQTAPMTPNITYMRDIHDEVTQIIQRNS
ncbi:MAG: hypothetical protein EBV06_18195 [Planctomycetia bacterium]|nr:hypothetical protein [Planctomycetia bacterium]